MIRSVKILIKSEDRLQKPHVRKGKSNINTKKPVNKPAVSQTDNECRKEYVDSVRKETSARVQKGMRIIPGLREGI